MTVSVTNIWQDRNIEIQSGNESLPESVFISSQGLAGEFCIEVDRVSFIQAIKREFSLVEWATSRGLSRAIV